MVEAARRHLDEPSRELCHARVRRAEERGMGKPAELRRDGFVYLRNAVPEEVAPERRGAVEEAAAGVIDEVVAFGCHDDERIGSEILLHLREGMPDVLCVPLSNVASRHKWGLTPFSLIGVRPQFADFATAAAKRTRSSSVIG